MPSVVLFGAIPGAPELLVLLLILFVLVLPAVVIVGLVLLGVNLLGGSDESDRVAELERELEETKAELAELRAEHAEDEGTGDTE